MRHLSSWDGLSKHDDNPFLRIEITSKDDVSLWNCITFHDNFIAPSIQGTHFPWLEFNIIPFRNIRHVASVVHENVEPSFTYYAIPILAVIRNLTSASAVSSSSTTCSQPLLKSAIQGSQLIATTLLVLRINTKFSFHLEHGCLAYAFARTTKSGFSEARWFRLHLNFVFSFLLEHAGLVFSFHLSCGDLDFVASVNGQEFMAGEDAEVKSSLEYGDCVTFIFFSFRRCAR